MGLAGTMGLKGPCCVRPTSCGYSTPESPERPLPGCICASRVCEHARTHVSSTRVFIDNCVRARACVLCTLGVRASYASGQFTDRADLVQGYPSGQHFMHAGLGYVASRVWSMRECWQLLIALVRYPDATTNRVLRTCRVIKCVSVPLPLGSVPLCLRSFASLCCRYQGVIIGTVVSATPRRTRTVRVLLPAMRCRAP